MSIPITLLITTVFLVEGLLWTYLSFMQALTPNELSKLQNKRGRYLTFRKASEELMTFIACIFPIPSMVI